MNKIKAVQVFALIIITILVTSCTKDNSIRLSDISETEKVDLVKINFLSEFGGIELERYSICNLASTKSEICKLDTSLNIKLDHHQGNFEINLDGKYSIKCSNSWNVYNNRFINYINNRSKGKSTLNTISQDFDLQSSISIAGNTEDEIYVTSFNTIRNIKYTSEKFEDFNGSINFVSNLCNFNFNNCLLTEKTEYSFNLTLRDKKESDVLKFKGTIKLIDNKWTLISSEGIIVTLE